ncbi:MAG: hypothetical protein GX336_02340 [Halanaerobiaceae bacterium]|nr:hypothetical protein [Halanaerobiaceae bacterium]
MNWMKKVEDLFYNYTEKYDENIKTLMQEREVEITMEELNEILADAKNITVK